MSSSQFRLLPHRRATTERKQIFNVLTVGCVVESVETFAHHPSHSSLPITMSNGPREYITVFITTVLTGQLLSLPQGWVCPPSAPSSRPALHLSLRSLLRASRRTTAQEDREERRLQAMVQDMDADQVVQALEATGDIPHPVLDYRPCHPASQHLLTSRVLFLITTATTLGRGRTSRRPRSSSAA